MQEKSDWSSHSTTQGQNRSDRGAVALLRLRMVWLHKNQKSRGDQCLLRLRHQWATPLNRLRTSQTRLRGYEMDLENCLRRHELAHCRLMLRCNILALTARPLNSIHHLPAPTHKNLTDNIKKPTTTASTPSRISCHNFPPRLADKSCLKDPRR